MDSENYLPICGDGLLGNQGITYNLPKFSDGPNFAYYNFDITLPNGTKNPIDSFIKISNIADYGLSSCFYQQTIPTKGCKNYYFPLYDNGIKRGIEKATNKNYSSRFTVVPEKEINNNNPLMIVVHCDHYLLL